MVEECKKSTAVGDFIGKHWQWLIAAIVMLVLWKDQNNPNIIRLEEKLKAVVYRLDRIEAKLK